MNVYTNVRLGTMWRNNETIIQSFINVLSDRSEWGPLCGLEIVIERYVNTINNYK